MTLIKSTLEKWNKIELLKVVTIATPSIRFVFGISVYIEPIVIPQVIVESFTRRVRLMFVNCKLELFSFLKFVVVTPK